MNTAALLIVADRAAEYRTAAHAVTLPDVTRATLTAAADARGTLRAALTTARAHGYSAARVQYAADLTPAEYAAVMQ